MKVGFLNLNPLLIHLVFTSPGPAEALFQKPYIKAKYNALKPGGIVAVQRTYVESEYNILIIYTYL